MENIIEYHAGCDCGWVGNYASLSNIKKKAQDHISSHFKSKGEVIIQEFINGSINESFKKEGFLLIK